MEAMKDLRYLLPPIVRGMAHDGETSLMVATVQLEEPAELMLAAPLSMDQSTVALWRSAFTGFCSEHARYPRTIAVAGQPWAVALGATLEEARSASGPSLPYGVPGSTKRGDIMKRKIALVTGGAQGFGEGIVRSLVSEGGFAYVADLNLAGASKLADELNERAGRVVAVALKVDVSDEVSVAAMMDTVAVTTGSLDLFVANAGVLRAGSVKEMALKDFQFTTSIDYTGFFICTKHAARQLAWQNLASGGTYMTDIIAMGSKSGLQGSNRNGAYAGAKFGTIGLVQSFALELVEDNIKVNAVCPGNFLDGPLWSDPQQGLFVQYLKAGKVPGAKTIADVRRFYEAKVPLNRGCRTEDVVRAICYIVEQKYETGQAVPVTGGQVMVN